MIITCLRLEPFGYISSQELTFDKGLNVILGPNETGKSTVFHAIQKVLFTPSTLTKPVFNREMARFIPLGGDTASVEISFIIKDRQFILKRSWGSVHLSRLYLPDGTILTDESKIEGILADILPATGGTFKAVLMTYQTGLVKTIEDIEENYPETIQTLGDILRRAVLETDGVSVEGFRGKINSLYEEYFSHWDIEREFPEKGRGIRNPWQREVGRILRVFYEKERIREELDFARRYEEGLDSLNRYILECSQNISCLERFVSENERMEKDIRERKAVEAQIKAYEASIRRLKDIAEDWPVREKRLHDLKKGLPEIQKRLKELEEERRIAEEEERNRKIRERFRKIQEKKRSYEELKRELEGLKRITGDDLREIKRVEGVLNDLRTRISAGKLTLKMKANENLTLWLQKDLEEREEHTLTAGGEIELEAGGIIRLGHEAFDMEITSGRGNIGELLAEYRSKEAQFQGLLHTYEVQSMEEAIEISDRYERKAREVEWHRHLYQEELGDERYDELEARIREPGDRRATMSLVEIVEGRSEARNALDNTTKEIDEIEKVIGNYAEEFGDKDRLFEMLGREMSLRKELQDKLDRFTPVPEGVDIDAFLSKYDRKKRELEDLKGRLNDLRYKKATMEGQAPDASCEELEKALEEAEEEFMRVKKRGEAILRIKRLTESLLDSMDRDTYLGLKRELEDYVSYITGNKYREVEMGPYLPEGFRRSDGKMLPYTLFSTGTKDALSLALRLTMADYFLKDADGFMAMDDPLVNMDPERQKRASEVLQEYARKKQLIIFTCHPTHASLLGVRVISLLGGVAPR